MVKRTVGILNIKRKLQKEYIYGRRSFLPQIKRKAQHIPIFQMVKYYRHFPTTQVKKKDCQKNMIKMEI